MVSKKIGLVYVSFILSILLISIASAEIIISQPNALYSLGDELSFEVELSETGNGYMGIDLKCNEKITAIYVNVPDSKTISITRKLTPDYIGDLQGNCYLEINYDNQKVLSQTFQISKDIDLVLEKTYLSYEAGKTVQIKGQAYKKNNILLGQIYPAYIEVSMLGTISKKEVVKDGQFNVEFLTPENLKAGSYPLTIKIYDEDEKGNILNNKETIIDVGITQKPVRIDVALDKTLIIAGENLSVTPFIYDAAGEIYPDKVLLKINSVDSKIIYEQQVDSGSNVNIEIISSSLPGDYIVNVKSGNFVSEKILQVGELRRISSEIINDTLVIKNIGNVRYQGIIQVDISGQTINQEIDLAVGQKRIFALSAPNGNYDISIKSDADLFVQGGVPLTGNAIKMSDVRSMVGNIWTNYLFMWLFILIILILGIWILIKKTQGKRKFYAPSASGKDMRTLGEIKRKGGVEIIQPNRVMDKVISGEEARRAEQVMVLHGQKQPTSIIALKIKSGLNGIVKQTFEKALEEAYKKKAVSYSSGNQTILIFSPLITRTNNNEENAIRTAIEIDKILSEHNKRFRNDIIRYGIGVNCGEIINKMEGKVLQFTSIDKTIMNAKKISDLAQDEVLLSQPIHNKTMNNIKADKFTSGAMELFKIKRVVDTEKSKKFINEFMRRN